MYQKTRTQSLADVKSLTMWGYELVNVDIVGQMVNAETLSFPINHISGLAPFSYCKNLKNLFLRQNEISDFRELDYLKGLQHLTVLSLADNPICSDSSYRDIVIRKLPQIRKLDDTDVNAKEMLRPRAENDFHFEEAPVSHRPQQAPRPSGHHQDVRQAVDPAVGQRRQFKVIRPRDEEHGSARVEVEMRLEAGRSSMRGLRKSGDDSNILKAVLALIPELGVDSLQVVLRAIQDRCL